MFSLGKDEILVKVPTVIIERTVRHPVISEAIGETHWVIVVELGTEHYECIIDNSISLADAIAINDGVKERDSPDYLARMSEFMSNQQLTPRFVVLKSRLAAPGKSEICIKAIGLDPTNPNKYFAKIHFANAQDYLGL